MTPSGRTLGSHERVRIAKAVPEVEREQNEPERRKKHQVVARLEKLWRTEHRTQRRPSRRPTLCNAAFYREHEQAHHDRKTDRPGGSRYCAEQTRQKRLVRFDRQERSERCCQKH